MCPLLQCACDVQSIDFDNIRHSRAPYVPEILHETDTSNFDPPELEPGCDEPPLLEPDSDRREEKPKVPIPNAFPLPFSADGWRPFLQGEHAFYEFTFRRFFDSDPQGCPTLRRVPGPNARPSLAPLMESASPLGPGVPGGVPGVSGVPVHAPNVSVLRVGDEEEEAALCSRI